MNGRPSGSPPTWRGCPSPWRSSPSGSPSGKGALPIAPIRITGGDGVEREIEVTAFPLCPRPNVIVGAVAVFWDRPPVEG